jgi:ribose 5-phosphate isomerase
MQDHDLWMKQDMPFVTDADCMIVISHKGEWKNSKGVSAEVARNLAVKNGLFVFEASEILSGEYKIVIENSNYGYIDG